MIEFFLKYWLELIMSILISSTVYIFKQYMGIKSGMQSLLRNEIVGIYEIYSNLGYCPSYMKENLNEVYLSYHKLNGNGMATTMVNELFKLPSQKGESDENKIIDRIVELLKVKSLITVITFFTFSYLSLNGEIDTDNFMFVMGLITTYFFNKDKISS